MRQTTIFLIVLLSITSPLFSDVFVNLPDTSAFPADTSKIPVNVSDLTGLEVYSYQFKIKYDATIIRAIGVDSAGTLTETWEKTWLNLETPGEVVLGNYGTSPLKNSGTLIYILFELSDQIGDSTKLEVHDFEFNAGNPSAITTDGSIKILHPPVAVSFKSNIQDSMRILIDDDEKILPFDTTWVHGSVHTIEAISPQYKTMDKRFVFHNWSDGGDAVHQVVPVSDTIFTLNMIEQYLLTLNSEYGSVSGGGWYEQGTAATFSVDSLFRVSDSSRFVFTMWDGTGKNSYTGTQRTNTIIMDNPVVETAKWELQYSLKIDSPYGTPVGAGWYAEGDTVTINIDSLVSLNEGTRLVFKSWSGSGISSYTGNERMVDVVMSNPIFQMAQWETEHYLWIKSKPDNITDFVKAGWYPQYQNVFTDTAKQVIQYSEYTYQFLNWSLDGNPLVDNPIQILMDTSHIAEAVYLIDSVFVSITTSIGHGTSILIEGIKYPVPYSAFWKYQSEHHVWIDMVQYDVGERTRYLFESWENGAEQSRIVKADSALYLTATLSTQHQLVVDTHPAGLIDFAETGWYNQGDTVDVAPAPDQIIADQDTFNFRGWHLENKPVEGNSIQVIMDSYHSAIALYHDLYFIKGQIVDRRSNPLNHVELILSGIAQDTSRTLNSNEYCFNFLTQGDYRVTPSLFGFQFSPHFREYAPLSGSLQNQNFTAIDTLKPNLTLVHPIGGEKLQGASIDTITWQVKDNVGIALIEIDLSTDNGTTWQEISKINPTTQNYYIWTVPDINASNCKIRVRAIDFDGNYSTDSNASVFSIEGSSEISETSEGSVPNKFEVMPNYPNPFNSTTALRFQIPEACQVAVRVFNLKGQEIVVLMNKKLNRGIYQIEWDGKDLFGSFVGSGIYFYQVEASSQVLTRRMLYLR